MVSDLVLERQPDATVNLGHILCTALEVDYGVLRMIGIVFVMSDGAPHVDSREDLLEVRVLENSRV